jgi:hypothetical protein
LCRFVKQARQQQYQPSFDSSLHPNLTQELEFSTFLALCSIPIILLMLFKKLRRRWRTAHSQHEAMKVRLLFQDQLLATSKATTTRETTATTTATTAAVVDEVHIRIEAAPTTATATATTTATVVGEEGQEQFSIRHDLSFTPHLPFGQRQRTSEVLPATTRKKTVNTPGNRRKSMRREKFTPYCPIGLEASQSVSGSEESSPIVQQEVLMASSVSFCLTVSLPVSLSTLRVTK